MTDNIIDSFVEEVGELLLQLEDDLIGLEKNPGNKEIINNIFRVMHTLKGSSGMVGYKNIQDLTHEFEGAYEQIREGKVAITTDIINLTLKGKDLILSMLKGENSETSASGLIKIINTLFFAEHDKKSENFKNSSPGENPSQHSYVILFSPDKAVFERGLDPDNALRELNTTGKTHIILHEKKKSWEKQKAEKLCQTSWEIYLNSLGTITEIEEVFLFYDQDEFEIFEVAANEEKVDETLSGKLRRLYKNKKLPEQHVIQCFNLLPEIPISQNPVNSDTEGQTSSENQSENLRVSDIDSTINVSSQKLDELMNLVSELVTLTDTIKAHAEKFNDPKLKNSIEDIEKLTKKFRNNALDLRLVPVGSLLTKFKRQVRDLSKDLGKKINLLIEGQDIEIDKTILKSIENPLQHIIRNSIDHGLEKEEERLAKGKTPEGLLKITAFYSGASVIVQVQDDGKGINLDRVKECAISKGLIQSDQAVTKEDLIKLIMEPGFTTSENVSLVSGRGVGMDVVRIALNRVGGSLEVFTEKDLGTSITMKLPTTLTIVDTLMVEVSETQILIPVMDIEYCFMENSENLFRKDNRYIEYKNYPIPLISLREQFQFPVYDKNNTMVIVINKFDKRYAITADRIVGEHQAVIKPLGDLFINQPFFSGGSIMVDGKLALILDTNFLFNHIK
jgi:two-component system chemotaxis sensor kinase CheA